MVMKMKPANGVEGCLIYVHATNTHVFRVYDADYNFKDYNILHNDLWISIIDADAYFYEQPDGTIELDHSPETLGLTIDTK